MNTKKDAFILIVDDNPQNLQVLGQVLKEEGYKLAVTQNGLEALDFVKKKKPHLILMDVMMPEIDGIETCRQLMADPETRDIPVIFLTGLTDTWNKTKAFEAGGKDFVTKPFAREELLARVSVNIARKLAEDENRESERKLQLVNEALQRTNEKLHNAVATKDKFLAIIAHDLNNPLGTLMSCMELLSSEIDQLSSAEIQNIALKGQQSAKNLHELLNNLLIWSRAQVNILEFYPQILNLQAISQLSLAAVADSAGQKNIAIHNNIENNHLVYADANMLNTVLRNLVSNAVKFTPLGGLITLSAKSDAGFVEVTVTDTGVGIHPDDLAKFFRLDIHHTTLGTANETGSGMGMILCKEFVEKNGGQIHVESTPGKGSVIRFTMPIPLQPL